MRLRSVFQFFTTHLWLPLLLAALLALVPDLARAATFTVTTTDDTNDGVCDNQCSLREAILASNASAGADTIVLDPGLYQLTLVGNSEDDAGGDLDIRDDLTITGAGSQQSIVDGAGFPVDRKERVMQIHRKSNGALPAVNISGITIRNGTPTSLTSDGGGIYAEANLSLSNTAILSNTKSGLILYDGSLFLSQSRVAYNRSESNGGGAYIYKDAVVVGSRIEENLSTAGRGGGLTIDGNLTMTGTYVSGNVLDSASNSYLFSGGGGLWIMGETRIVDSEFFSNTVFNRGGGSGGAIYVYNGDSNNPGPPLQVSGSTFIGNRAEGGRGGAVHHQWGDETIVTNSRFENNRAANGGALSGSGIIANNSTFIGNTAINGQGGGIWAGTVQVTGSRLERNSAQRGEPGFLGAEGGAFYSTDAIVDSTIFISNTAIDGGAIWSQSLAMRDSQVVGNHAGDGSVDGEGRPAGGNGGGARLGSVYYTTNITDTVFSSNTADGFGGALATGHANLFNVRFEQNRADVAGGGVYHWPPGGYAPNSTFFLRNVQFLENAAGRGGAIAGAVEGSIENSQFLRNQATGGWGGAIEMGSNGYAKETLRVTSSVFTGNSASESAGAIASSQTSEIFSTTFQDNYAGADAGALWVPRQGTITTTLFLSNTAGANGGALSAYNASVSEVSFIGNRAAAGGAIYYGGSSYQDTNLSVRNALFARNQATGAGAAALHLVDGRGSLNYVTIGDTAANGRPAIQYTTGCSNNLGCGYLTVRNSILANHAVGIEVAELGGPGEPEAPLGVDYLLFSGLTQPISTTETVNIGSNNLRGNPDFVNPAQDNYELGAASQARDAGDSADCLPADIRGMARPQGLGCDIGAYEGAPMSPAIAITPTVFSFIVMNGMGAPAPQSLGIQNIGVGTLNWSIAANAGWLSASPASGVQTSTAAVSVNHAGLAVGTHQGVLTVSGNAVNPQATASVQVEVLNACVPLVANGDFEAGGNGVWQQSGNLIRQDSEMGGLGSPRSGQYAVVLGSANGDQHELAQAVKLPSGGALSLTYYYQIASQEENCTFDTVRVLLDDTILAEHGLCPANNTSGWQQRTIDLAPYGNRQGNVRFVQQNDAFGSPSVFLLDDVAIAAQSGATCNGPVLAVTPGSLVFNAAVGQGNPAAKTIQVSNGGSAALTWEASESSSWLSLDAASGAAPAVVAVTVDAIGLAPGIYNASIEFTAPGASGSPANVAVVFTVSEEGATANLQVSPAGLAFGADGSNPAAQNFAVLVTGGLAWTATESLPWLSLDRTSGTGNGSVQVNINAAGLGRGSYSGQIVVTAPGSIAQVVTVSLTVANVVTGGAGQYSIFLPTARK